MRHSEHRTDESEQQGEKTAVFDKSHPEDLDGVSNAPIVASLSWQGPARGTMLTVAPDSSFGSRDCTPPEHDFQLFYFSILEKFNVIVSDDRSQCSIQKLGNPSVRSSKEYTVAFSPSLI